MVKLLKDIIDYKFHMGTDDFLELEVQKPYGDIWDIEIEKDLERFRYRFSKV